ncbi:MAG TPA: flagellar biosynthesis protein FlhA, partial [Casimicrobiaceae bacterium]|nr:flagellar biosynthesis protein FlhA [Casimicrobiaceae bacterium]
AAGKVIEAFAQFLVGGNFAVGIVVFAILVVINFVVITKGAGRIAEVSARFALDAMPGKQMAIDADLNAGLIGEDDARKRRVEIATEADFYGAMDGASKFVRGDAIAAILILFINIVFGLAIGVMQHDLDIATAAHDYVLLAIGDGLVAQIPALVISTAAGLMVSRVGKTEAAGPQIVTQLLRQPQSVAIAGIVLATLGLVPAMPHVAFLLLATGLGFGARALFRRRHAQGNAATIDAAPLTHEPAEVGWDDVTPVDVLGLEVGYRLIPLVDKGVDGELLRRIRAIRRKFAQDIGFLPPAVHIRDNLELAPNAYRILLKGVTIAQGECRPGAFLAIDPGGATGSIGGQPTTDPAFGLPAQWIDGAQRDPARAMGYTVVDAGTVVATHLSTLVNRHASQLLGRAEVQGVLDRVALTLPKLVEEVTPKLLPLASVQRVLQSLLDESVPLRDIRTILETLADHAPRSQDPQELTAAVRVALGPAIVQHLFGQGNELAVITLDGELERVLTQVLAGVAADGGGIEPDLAETIIRELGNAARQQDAAGLPPVLVTSDRLRAPLARLVRRGAPELRVLAQSEIPSSRALRARIVIGGKS